MEAISAGLALTSAAIIFVFLQGNADTQLLFLSLLCCLIIAIYQIINFYLGHTLQKKIEQSRTKDELLSTKRVEVLESGESTAFVDQHSVVENTTERLDAVPRKVKR
jgi:hypothetical protein